MSVLLAAASLLVAEPVILQSSGQATGRRTHQPVRMSRNADTYPSGDLLEGQPNLFPGVEWRNVRVRTVDATAFPGSDWQPAGHCRGPNGLYGLVYRAAGDADDRPTEEVAFYYQKIVFARPSQSNIGSSGEDGARRAPDSFFDIFTDLGEDRAALNRHGQLTVSNIGSSGEDGVSRRAPSNIGSSGDDGVEPAANRHGNLTVSNIGSSGEDGVRAPGTTRAVTSVQWPYQLSAATLQSSNHCPQ